MIIIDYQLGNQPQKIIINRIALDRIHNGSSDDGIKYKYLLHLQAFLIQQLFKRNTFIIIVIIVKTKVKLKMTKMIQQLIL